MYTYLFLCNVPLILTERFLFNTFFFVDICLRKVFFLLLFIRNYILTETFAYTHISIHM